MAPAKGFNHHGDKCLTGFSVTSMPVALPDHSWLSSRAFGSASPN